jgi:hypothetical protein
MRDTGQEWRRDWTAVLVLAGLALRLMVYLRDLPVWQDESYLILNVLNKGFTSLLGPLADCQAAAPLFLWTERLAVLTLGAGTYALRLVPLLAGCAGMLLMAVTARRLLDPRAVPWGLLLFAGSDMLLWHACEAKPYATDVLAATALLGLYAVSRSWPLGRRLLVFALLAPGLMGLAYPACFLYGGVLTALLPAVVRAQSRQAWWAYGLLAVAVLGTFGLLLVGPIHAQRNAELVAYWQRLGQFPPLGRPGAVPWWTMTSCLEVFRYCVKPTGQLVAVLAVVGAIRLVRRGQAALTMMLVVPALLPLGASFAGVYPFGGSRLLVYQAPAVVLLLAEGTAATLTVLWPRSRTAAVGLGALMLVPLAVGAWHGVDPWMRPDCARASAYVLEHRLPGDGVAATNCESRYYFRHLGAQFTPATDGTRLEPVASHRLWLVVLDKDADRRRGRIRELMPAGWEPLFSREFIRVTVALFGDPHRGDRASRAGPARRWCRAGPRTRRHSAGRRRRRFSWTPGQTGGMVIGHVRSCAGRFGV